MEGTSKVFDELPEGDIPLYISVNATSLLFPEKLMYLMIFMEREYSGLGKQASEAPIGWDLEGNVVKIHNVHELEKTWLPRFFSTKAKFSSFTRKLYRWGFRRVVTNWHVKGSEEQLQGLAATSDKDKAKPNLLCFHNHNFRRDDKQLLYRMQSLTPEKVRRNQAKEYNRILRLKEEEAGAAPQVYPVLASTMSTSFAGNLLNSASLAIQQQPIPQHTYTGTTQRHNNESADPRLLWELQNNYLACQYLLSFNNAAATASSWHAAPVNQGRETTELSTTLESPNDASTIERLALLSAISSQGPQPEGRVSTVYNVSVSTFTAAQRSKTFDGKAEGDPPNDKA